MTIEKKYRLLDDIEHVRKRTGMYIGSIVPDTKEDWVIRDGNIVKESITYNPGLIKIFSEILDNSIDEHKRDPKKLNVIKVTVDKKTGELTVWDNGGIPVVIHKETKQYVPTMIFTNLKAGSNFDDEVDQSLIGTNGVGSSITAVLSNSFELTTCDGKKKLYLKITDGLRNISKEKITAATKGFTEVKFTPDYQFFGEDGLSDGNFDKIFKRVHDCAACNPKLTFEFNGEKIKFKAFKDYVKMYSEDFVMESAKDWDIALAPSSDGFEQVSFVNSVETYEGGTHVDYVLTPIITYLREHFEKKYKLKLKPSELKQNMRVFVSAGNINRPKFDSQTKARMISTAKDFKSEYKPTDTFLKSILKSSVIKTIVAWAEQKKEMDELEALNEKNKNIDKSSNYLRDITKYEPATSKNRSRCSLYIAEGDSAASAILSARNPEFQGVMPLKGKPVNVRGVKLKALLENEELASLMAILGLKFGKKHFISELRYHELVIAVDQDLDGIHLCSLLVNMFHELWPDLVKQGFLFKLQTPIVRVTQGKKEIEFLSLNEFYAWEKKQNSKNYSTNYLKGLGSSDTKYFKEYLSNPTYKVPITYTGKEDSMALDIAFDKTKADERKKFIYG